MAGNKTKINQPRKTKRHLQSAQSFHQAVDSGGSKNISSRAKKQHYCHYCEKFFGSSSELVTHIRYHTGERPFQCNWAGCKKNYLRKPHLKVHISTVHENEKRFECDLCGLKSNNKYSLQKHMKTHSDNKKQRRSRRKFNCSCPYCQTLDKGGEKVVDSKGRKLHICHHEACGRIFYGPSTLRNHLARHTAAAACTWPTCKKSFISVKDLKKHILSHEKQDDFKCITCGYMPNLNENFNCNEIQKRGKKETNFKCPCPFCQVVEAGGDKVLDSKGKRLHKCPYENCGKIFEYTSFLFYHVERHKKEHFYKCVEQDRDEGDLECKLEVNPLSGKKNYVCDICGFISPIKKKVIDHFNTIHKKDFDETHFWSDDSKNHEFIYSEEKCHRQSLDKNISKEKGAKIIIKSVNIVKDLVRLPGANQIKLVIASDESQTQCDQLYEYEQPYLDPLSLKDFKKPNSEMEIETQVVKAESNQVSQELQLEYEFVDYDEQWQQQKNLTQEEQEGLCKSEQQFNPQWHQASKKSSFNKIEVKVELEPPDLKIIPKVEPREKLKQQNC